MQRHCQCSFWLRLIGKDNILEGTRPAPLGMVRVCFEALRYGSADFEAGFTHEESMRQVKCPGERVQEEAIRHVALGDLNRILESVSSSWQQRNTLVRHQ